MISNTKSSLHCRARQVAQMFAVGALMATTVAHADPEPRDPPLGVSIGIGGGLAPSHRICQGANKQDCDRVSFGHKVSVGYDVTNDVTAQVNYLYFNSVNRNWSDDTSKPNSLEQVASRAWSMGIDWHIDLLHSVTNHLRVGVGRLETVQTNYARSTGVATQANRFDLAPYVGAGLALNMTEYLSVEAGFDYYFAGSQSRHLLSISAIGQF